MKGLYWCDECDERSDDEICRGCDGECRELCSVCDEDIENCNGHEEVKA